MVIKLLDTFSMIPHKLCTIVCIIVSNDLILFYDALRCDTKFIEKMCYTIESINIIIEVMKLVFHGNLKYSLFSINTRVNADVKH